MSKPADAQDVDLVWDPGAWVAHLMPHGDDFLIGNLCIGLAAGSWAAGDFRSSMSVCHAAEGKYRQCKLLVVHPESLPPYEHKQALQPQQYLCYGTIEYDTTQHDMPLHDMT